MRKFNFSDHEDFSALVDAVACDLFGEDECNDVSIVADYYDTREVLEEMIMRGYSVNCVEIKNPDLGYDDVLYITSLTCVDGDKNLWCEPFERNGEYLKDGSTVIYVLDYCPSKVLKCFEEESIVYEVHLVDEEDFCCACDECAPVHKEKEECKPSTTSHSYYEVNGKEVSREEFEEFKDEIDEKYLDTVRDMLLKHCSIMDEINEFGSRLMRFH